MCEVCKAEGHNWKFRNGDRGNIYNSTLYKVFKDSIASVRLCYIHNIELFMGGEKKFLQEHILFARELAKKTARRSSEETSPFGF